MAQAPKIILITGSTDGIGFETARWLASEGHQLIIHGRTPERLESALNQIHSASNTNLTTGVTGDLSSLQQVGLMAEQLISRFNYLDVLINNAGVIMKDYQCSEDGYERTFAINHLGHFYLTGLILPLLQKARPSRIINISSEVHSQHLDLDDLVNPVRFESMKAYANSKLCNLLFTYRLSELISDASITVNAQHPGVINTKMLKGIWGAVGAPLKNGADNVCYLAVSSAVAGITGAYFNGQKRTRSSAASNDTGLQKALWDFSLDLIERAGFTDPYPCKLN